MNLTSGIGKENNFFCTILDSWLISHNKRQIVLCVLNCSVVSNSLQSFWVVAHQALYPWDSSGRILVWVSISSSRGPTQPRDQTPVSPMSPALQVDSLPTELSVKPKDRLTGGKKK